VFARRADGDLASFAGKIDELVGRNAARKARGTVVLLAKKNDVAATLEKMAKDQKIEHVPLTVSKDEEKGPEEYRLSAKVPVTVVVYDKDMNVTAVLELEKLDAKSQEAALAAFKKVIDAAEPEKTDEKAEKKADEPVKKPEEKKEK
jgi:hypothetical protein